MVALVWISPTHMQDIKCKVNSNSIWSSFRCYTESCKVHSIYSFTIAQNFKVNNTSPDTSVYSMKGLTFVVFLSVRAWRLCLVAKSCLVSQTLYPYKHEHSYHTGNQESNISVSVINAGIKYAESYCQSQHTEYKAV